MCSGGVVVNEKDEVLCIREKYVGDLKHAYSQLWKLPGGHVDPGEDLGTAVEREVSEETNIKATFKGTPSYYYTSTSYVIRIGHFLQSSLQNFAQQLFSSIPIVG